MATSLSQLDQRVNGRREAELRDVAHALNARIGHKGWVWLSHRTFSRDVLHMGSAVFLECVAELIAMGEFYRVTARGRGQGRGRTLYFKGWARYAVMRQLEHEKMPMAAIHAAERVFAEHDRRVLFVRKNASRVKRQEIPSRGSHLGKDGREAPDRLIKPPGGPPGPRPTPSQQPGTPRPYGPLARHGERMRQLRAQIEALGSLHPH